jgi:Lon protease-like protein
MKNKLKGKSKLNVAFDPDLGIGLNEKIHVEDLFSHGCVARIVQMHKDIRGKYIVTLEGLARFKSRQTTMEKQVPYVQMQIFDETGTFL